MSHILLECSSISASSIISRQRYQEWASSTETPKLSKITPSHIRFLHSYTCLPRLSSVAADLFTSSSASSCLFHKRLHKVGPRSAAFSGLQDSGSLPPAGRCVCFDGLLLLAFSTDAQHIHGHRHATAERRFRGLVVVFCFRFFLTYIQQFHWGWADIIPAGRQTAIQGNTTLQIAHRHHRCYCFFVLYPHFIASW